MKTVTLGVSSRAASKRRLAGALAGKAQGEFITFATVELLWKVLTAKRWEILRVMAGEGKLSIREVARRVQRDVKSAHGDVTALIDAGVIERTEQGVQFPYDAVHVDFTLVAA